MRRIMVAVMLTLVAVLSLAASAGASQRPIIVESQRPIIVP